MSRDQSFDPGVRCPVYDGPGEKALRCSRDSGHPGAHVHRADRGRGAIGWAPWAGEPRPGEDDAPLRPIMAGPPGGWRASIRVGEDGEYKVQSEDHG